ncbi:hypothetical protein CEXT_497661 [Caerostris extrusa]|uniref:Uncharacterized protein n=1 Tax=Caerostris extrusa TaxID=172846 RepID=A0AAV4XUG8_CAEEX|nr:hypothetical protein CEXT_497661 [Caerostris extrusa]
MLGMEHWLGMEPSHLWPGNGRGSQLTPAWPGLTDSGDQCRREHQLAPRRLLIIIASVSGRTAYISITCFSCSELNITDGGCKCQHTQDKESHGLNQKHCLIKNAKPRA